MNVGIMQPYLFPYLGYFHLLHAVDTVVIYDDIEYTKKGWINRNRVVHDGRLQTFTVPLRKASDYLEIREREISPSFDKDKLRRQLGQAFNKCEFGEQSLAIVDSCLACDESNLFSFVAHSLDVICEELALKVHRVRSSTVGIDRNLRGEERVLAICESLGGTTYRNLPGGVALYDSSRFAARGVSLEFISPSNRAYTQRSSTFIPKLSILDTIANLSIDTVRHRVGTEYAVFSQD
jgi:hypothetical protein